MKTIMNDSAFTAKGYSISADKNLLDIDMIFGYLSNESYWAKGIPLEKLKRAIDNAVCFGIYQQNKQIGFARVITDKATFAYLADVFILETYRGKGLSKWLVQTILNDEELQGLRRWVLATADAQGLYSQFGFGQITNPERWMGIYTPYTQHKGEGN